MQDASGRGRFPCEVVGVITSEAEFRAALNALLAAGFVRADLSVLASHDSIEAAGRPASTWHDASVALLGDLRYEVPLVASGAVVLAGGPVAATIAAVIGAAVGGVAVKDYARGGNGETAHRGVRPLGRRRQPDSLGQCRRRREARQAPIRLLKGHGAINVHIAHPSTASALIRFRLRDGGYHSRAALCASTDAGPKQQKITRSGRSRSAR